MRKFRHSPAPTSTTVAGTTIRELRVRDTRDVEGDSDAVQQRTADTLLDSVMVPVAQVQARQGSPW